MKNMAALGRIRGLSLFSADTIFTRIIIQIYFTVGFILRNVDYTRIVGKKNNCNFYNNNLLLLTIKNKIKFYLKHIEYKILIFHSMILYSRYNNIDNIV